MTVTSAGGTTLDACYQRNCCISHMFKTNPVIDAQRMRFAAFILRRAECRQGRSRDETKYNII